MVLLTMCIRVASALTAFDCKGEGTSYIAMSANNIGECIYPKLTTSNKTSEYITVVQKLKYHSVPVTTCKVHIKQTIMHCGMHSHNSVSLNGLEEFEFEMTPSACKEMMDRSVWDYPYKPDVKINLKTGTKVYQTIYVIGTSDQNGACTTGNFVYKGIHYTDVFVTHFVSISLITREGRVDLEENFISMNGIRCPFSTGSCYDSEFGTSTWPVVTHDECNTQSYSTLYSGTSDVATLRDHDLQNHYTIVTVQQENQLFSLRLVKTHEKCFQHFWQTDQDGIYVIMSKIVLAFPRASDQTLKLNIQLSSYINTKLVFLEDHIQSQMEHLYFYKMCDEDFRKYYVLFMST